MDLVYQDDVELARLDKAVRAWVGALEKEPDAVDAAMQGAFARTIREGAVRLNKELSVDLDPTVLSEVRNIIINAVDDLDQLDPDHPLDILDSLLIRIESMRHILRDAFDGSLEAGADTSAEIVRWLEAQLAGVPRREVADLLGASARSVERWLASEAPPGDRLVLVAKLVGILRHSWTPRGVVAWFYRVHPDFGRAPIELLADSGRQQDLIVAARQGRSQHGS